VRDDTLGLLRAAGTPTLLVTHDAGEAVQVGDRLYAMREGRIVQAGSPAELYARPVDAFVAGFFGPLNRFEGTVEAGHVATPLGRFPALGVAEGAAAEAVVRPEAVRLRPPGQGQLARVLAHRDLGAYTTLQLGLEDGAVVEARLAGEAMCGTGEVVEIELDPRHLFVYPAAA
jgi:iron(III) transport system ATP-binding protein